MFAATVVYPLIYKRKNVSKKQRERRKIKGNLTFTFLSTCMFLNHFAVAGEHLADPVPHPLISLFFCGYNDEHIQLLISIRVMT